MKLKPCHKCGGKIIGVQSTLVRPYKWQGLCMRCGFSGPLRDSQEQAVKAWNEFIEKVQDSAITDNNS